MFWNSLIKPLFLFLLLLFSSSALQGKEIIHISPTGIDRNNGSKRYPIRTIEEGFSRAKLYRQNGYVGTIELRIHKGEYYLPNCIELNDISCGKINVVGDGVGKTIITGGIKIKGDIEEKDGINAIHLAKDITISNRVPQFFVNDKRKILARVPNAYSYFIPKNFEWKQSRNSSINGVIKLDLTTEAQVAISSIKNGKNIILSFLHDWSETRRYIDGEQIMKNTVSFSDPIGRSKQYFTRDGAKLFFFENDISFLDNPGEYYFNNNENCIYYIQENDEDITDAELVIPICKSLLHIAGRKDSIIQSINFKGITFEYTNYSMSDNGEEPYQSSNQSSAAVMIDYASGINFRDCEFRHTGEYALWFREGCSDCSVEHSYLHDLGAGGVKIGITNSPFSMEQDFKVTRRITIDNNIIKEGGRVLFPGAGILLMQASDCSIAHNDISDFYYSGISVGWTWGYTENPAVNNKIHHNHVHHLGWGVLSDLGGIYTLGVSTGTEISNNIIHHVYSFAENSWGIYLDEGTSNVLIKDNLVYDCKTAPFHQHYGKDNKVINNLFVTEKSMEIAKAENHTSLFFQRNIIISTSHDDVFGSTWKKAQLQSSNNIYWNILKNSSDLEVEINNSLDKAGLIVMDPIVRTDKNGNYIIKRKKTQRQIGFEGFSYKNVGVFGSSSWKSLAGISEERAKLFDYLTQ